MSLPTAGSRAVSHCSGAVPLPVPVGGEQCWSWGMDLDKFVSMVCVSLASARDEALHREGSSPSSTAHVGAVLVLPARAELQLNSLWHKPDPPTPK